MTRRLRNIAVALVMVLGLTVSFIRVRTAYLRSLYNQTATGLFTTHERVIAKLGGYHGTVARDLLLRIAMDPNRPSPDRVAAIQALARLSQADVAVSLANLLQPSQELSVRAAAAKALINMPCSTDCIRSVLHYEERIFKSEPDIEQAIPYPDEVSAQLEMKRKELQALLNQVLHKNGGDTVLLLQDIYGLGSMDPSPFAVFIVQQIKPMEACHPARGSLRSLANSYLPDADGIRDKLDETLNQMHCPSSEEN